MLLLMLHPTEDPPQQGIGEEDTQVAAVRSEIQDETVDSLLQSAPLERGTASFLVMSKQRIQRSKRWLPLSRRESCQWKTEEHAELLFRGLLSQQRTISCTIWIPNKSTQTCQTPSPADLRRLPLICDGRTFCWKEDVQCMVGWDV